MHGAPSADALKAFVLTFRLFFTDRDRLSFGQVEKIYRSLPVSDVLKAEISVIREEVGRYLNGTTPLVLFGNQPSRKAFFDIWLYGAVAHLNANKRQQIRAWRVDDDVRPFFEFEFETIMCALLQAIFWVRMRDLAALDEVEAQGFSSLPAA